MAIPILARIAGASLLRGNDKPQGVSTGLGMSLQFNSKALERKLAEIERKMPSRIDTAVFKAAQKGINYILARTEKGYGYKGAFAPYSSDYAIAKAEGWPRTASRSGFGGDPSGIVNLMVTGQMLGSLAAFKRRGYAVISANRASEAKKVYYNHKLRPFMGFTKTERRKLSNLFASELFK